MLIVANTLSVAVKWATLMLNITGDPLLYMSLRIAIPTEVFAFFLIYSRDAELLP
jgi:hypothetical protein